MATVQQLVGRWRLVESKGFDEYMKEVGVGMALRKVGAMAKPDCIITSDGKNLSIKTESTLKQHSFPVNWERSLKRPQLMAERLRLSATLQMAHWFNIRNGMERKAQ